jgi:hypothetical protein
MALTGAGAGPVTVEAFDVLGRRVATLYDGPVSAGDVRRLVFDAVGLPAGTYVVRAGDGVTRAIRRVTVVH